MQTCDCEAWTHGETDRRTLPYVLDWILTSCQSHRASDDDDMVSDGEKGDCNGK